MRTATTGEGHFTGNCKYGRGGKFHKGLGWPKKDHNPNEVIPLNDLIVLFSANLITRKYWTRSRGIQAGGDGRTQKRTDFDRCMKVHLGISCDRITQKKSTRPHRIEFRGERVQ